MKCVMLFIMYDIRSQDYRRQVTVTIHIFDTCFQEKYAMQGIKDYLESLSAQHKSIHVGLRRTSTYKSTLFSQVGGMTHSVPALN